MKRKEFLFKSLISGIGLGWGVDIDAKASDRQIEQVGFNHIKIMETRTTTTVLHKAATRGHANHGRQNS